jgi:glutamate synthase (NADPH) large chain
MPSNRPITPSSLSIKDHPWQIQWNKDKCTLCGSCTAVCPVNAIELGVFRKRVVETALGINSSSSSVFKVYQGIRQKTDPAYSCVGCAMCTQVCPNDAIMPMKSDEVGKLAYHINKGGQPKRRGGRRNVPGGLLDQIKFIRISMLTDRWMPDAMSLNCGPFWEGCCRRKKALHILNQRAGFRRSGKSIR